MTKKPSGGRSSGTQQKPKSESKREGINERMRRAAAGAMSGMNPIPAVPHPTGHFQTISEGYTLEEAIEDLAQSISSFPRENLLAAISILVADLDQFKNELDPHDAAFFTETFEPIIAEERRDHGGRTIFTPENKGRLATGIAEAYVKRAPRNRRAFGWRHTLDPMHQSMLASDEIINELTIGTGARISAKFAEKCKDVICGKSGPYEMFVKHSASQKALEAKIGVAILGLGIATWSPLVPLVTYLAVLLVKAGLKTLCES